MRRADASAVPPNIFSTVVKRAFIVLLSLCGIAGLQLRLPFSAGKIVCMNVMTGETLASPPVHFCDDGSANAIEKYNRFLAIYQVDKDDAIAGCTPYTEAAKFMGVAMNGAYGHLWAQNSALSFAYERM